jgi:hypothetical protein
MSLRSLGCAILAAMLVTGCSFQQTLDAAIDPERQQQIIANAQAFCGGNPASLLPQMHPDLRAQIEPQLPQVPSQCVQGNVPWQIAEFNISASTDTSGSQRQQAVTVIGGTDAGPWTRLKFDYRQVNDQPMQIMALNLEGVTERPAELDTKAMIGTIMTGLLVGGLLFVGLIIGLIVWLVRRRRRQPGIGG